MIQKNEEEKRYLISF